MAIGENGGRDEWERLQCAVGVTVVGIKMFRSSWR